MAVTDVATTSSFTEYRRSARRLRARHGQDLPTLHAGLMRLSAGTDRARGASPVSRTTGAGTHITRVRPAKHEAGVHPLLRDLPLDDRARGFAEAVLRSLTTDLLTYSSRAKLIRTADDSGIARFDANLIIALVQQRMGLLPATSMTVTPIDRSSDAQVEAVSLRSQIFSAVVVEILIIAAVLAVVHLA